MLRITQFVIIRRLQKFITQTFHQFSLSQHLCVLRIIQKLYYYIFLLFYSLFKLVKKIV